MDEVSVDEIAKLENGRTIKFRLVARDGPSNRWQVEIYSPEGSMFPVGFAFVVEIPGKAAQLNFALVADQWREQLFFHDLLDAIGNRWPGYYQTGRMD